MKIFSGVDSWDEFKERIELGGFISAHWDGQQETEDKNKEETKATIRVIPFDSEPKKENASTAVSHQIKG